MDLNCYYWVEMKEEVEKTKTLKEAIWMIYKQHWYEIL